jgi:uncharacterized protein (DUF433 family)
MLDNVPGVHSDPEILGGTPVFRGTRVPVRTLIDYFEHGRPLREFLEDFPSLNRELALSVLEHLNLKHLLTHAPSSR